MKVGLGAEVHPLAHVMQRARLTAAALLITQCAPLVIVLGASAAAAQQLEAPAPAAPLPTPAEPLATCTKDVRATCIKPGQHLAVPVQPTYTNVWYK